MDGWSCDKRNIGKVKYLNPSNVFNPKVSNSCFYS